MKIRIIGSFACLIALMYFTMGHMIGLPQPHWYHENALVAALLQFFLTLPVIYLNRAYYFRGLKALAHRAPNMDSLIAVGSLAALIYGVAALFRVAWAMGSGQWDIVKMYSENLYFESAAMILTLITLGKFLETRAKGKTGDAIRQLMDLSPKTANVRDDGGEHEVPVEQVKVGDIVVVRSGGSIPVDGTVIEGRAAVDQSALTGESVPVEKAVGDTVAAATINTEGFLAIRTDKIGEDITLAQVIRLVEEAGGSKAPIARLADKIAGVFVPVVMTISVIAFAVWMLLGQTLEFSLTTAIAAGVLYPAFHIQLSPMLAAAMSLSSVFVVTNALRLRMFRPKQIASAEPKKIIQEEVTMETVIHVEGMMCGHCKARVESACKAVAGVTDAVVDLEKKQVTVCGDAPVEAVKKAIADAGYDVVG